MRVLFDLDGVTFDFVRGFEVLMGFPIPDGSRDLVENFNLVDADFFANLEVIQDAVNLMYRLRDAGVPVGILSSAGDYRTAEVIEQKMRCLAAVGLDWIEDVNFVEHSHEKAQYAVDSILIDDREKSLAPFRAAGGVCYYYEDGRGDVIFNDIMAVLGR